VYIDWFASALMAYGLQTEQCSISSHKTLNYCQNECAFFVKMHHLGLECSSESIKSSMNKYKCAVLEISRICRDSIQCYRMHVCNVAGGV
jgi:hypothetical protein